MEPTARAWEIFANLAPAWASAQRSRPALAALTLLRVFCEPIELQVVPKARSARHNDQALLAAR